MCKDTGRQAVGDTGVYYSASGTDGGGSAAGVGGGASVAGSDVSHTKSIYIIGMQDGESMPKVWQTPPVFYSEEQAVDEAKRSFMRWYKPGRRFLVFRAALAISEEPRPIVKFL